MRKFTGAFLLLAGMVVASTASAQSGLRSSFFGGVEPSKITYTRIDNNQRVDLTKPTNPTPSNGQSSFSFSRFLPTFKMPEMFGGKSNTAPTAPSNKLPQTAVKSPFQPIKPFSQPK